MGTWSTRGLRGSGLEDLINYTIEDLREKKLAVIQKSTVDYVGAVQGIPVCFDAKECAVDTFPLQNIHEHQVEFMRDFEGQEGIAFLIIFFSSRHEFYYMTFREMVKFWKRWEDGGRRSFRITELDPRFFLEEKQHLLPILEGIQRDLSDREPDSAGECRA